VTLDQFLIEMLRSTASAIFTGGELRPNSPW